MSMNTQPRASTFIDTPMTNNLLQQLAQEVTEDVDVNKIKAVVEEEV